MRWDCSTRPGRSSGIPSVRWCPRRKHWVAKIESNKGRVHKLLFCECFKPADDSPEEVERAKLQAARSLAEARRALGLAVSQRGAGNTGGT